MRYYSISIGGPNPIRYSTVPTGGGFNPQALRVEFDIGVGPFGTPFQNSKVRIWGPGIDKISSATQLHGVPIKVFGGLQPGLPLATAAAEDGQLGLLVSGIIWKPYGNWIGTMQTLELPLLAGTTGGLNVTDQNVANLTLIWPKGTTLNTALQNCLQTAFPGAKVNFSIKSNLVMSLDFKQTYPSIYALSSDLKDITKAIIDPQGTSSYQGIDITFSDYAFQVSDGTGAPAAKAIKFQDLIGQPTWIDYPQIQFTTAMRADLGFGALVTLPQGQYTTQGPNSSVPGRSNTAQQGTYRIVQIHHVGDSRMPGAASWVSVFNAIPFVP